MFHIYGVIDCFLSGINERFLFSTLNWKPPTLSELTPYLISLGLTHFGSEASNNFLITPVLLKVIPLFPET